MKLLVCNNLGKWKCSIVIPLCQRIGRAHEWCSFTLCPVGTHSRISHGQISDWGLPNICSPKNTVLILKRLVKLPLFVFRRKQKTVESGKKMEKHWKWVHRPENVPWWKGSGKREESKTITWIAWRISRVIPIYYSLEMLQQATGFVGGLKSPNMHWTTKIPCLCLWKMYHIWFYPGSQFLSGIAIFSDPVEPHLTSS